MDRHADLLTRSITAASSMPIDIAVLIASNLREARTLIATGDPEADELLGYTEDILGDYEH